MITDMLQDVRIAVRSLGRVPVLAVTILATVGLGIGATTVIFGAVHAALLRPLPYAAPDELVRIYTDTPPFRFRFSVADYLALRDQQTHFRQIAAYTDRAMTFSDGTAAELLRGRVASSTYFSLLGISPMLGRDFTEADGRPGSPRSVIASHAFWQQRLGGREDAIGRTVRLDGADYMLVGVLGPRVGPLEGRQDFFIAAQFAAPPRRGPFLYTVLARLPDGVDNSVAADELRAINRRIFPVWKSSYQDEKATWSMVSLHTHVVGDVRALAALALAAVGLVWLIACTNASNLLVARVASRQRELAVRAALGASRGRVLRYLLAESALLAGGAVIVGTGIAWGGIQLLRGVGAAYFPRTREIALEGPVLWLMAGLTIASALIFALVAATHGTGGPLDQSLRSLGRSATGGPRVRRLRRVLVASQFAIATPLLVVAVLLVTSLNELRKVDLGFDSRNVVTGSVRLPATLYSRPESVTSFWTELETRLARLPGVTGVAFADGTAPNNVGNVNNFDLEQHPAAPGQSQPATPWVGITPSYFHVLGLTRLEGRLLEDRDALTDNLESVVVDRAWARRFFPNESAIGKRFKEGGCTDCPWTSVVGVVSDVKYAGLDAPDQGTVYWPLVGSVVRFFVLRTQPGAPSPVAAIRETLRALDPGVPLSNIATMEELVAQSLQSPQYLSMLVGAFALVALVLSMVGIYGVMTHYVQQQAKEISIRMALGGSAADVLRLILRQGMVVVAAGVAVGVLTAIALAQTASSLLFGVGAGDWLPFVAVSATLLTAALVACLVPARRALAAQPAAVLRME